MADRPPLTSLSEAARARALERVYCLQPHLEAGQPLTPLARRQAIPPRTARRWVQQYRQHGLAGLARQPRGDRGRRKLLPDMQQLIEGLVLRKPLPTVAAIHRQVRKVAGEHGWPAPSYGTVYAVVQRLDRALITLAHEGPQAYKEQYDLLY